MKITISWIRHGKTKANETGCYLGETDEGLSELGKQELNDMVLEQKGKQEENAIRLFSSPMLRCKESCNILLPEQEPILIPEWQEMDFGNWEGKNYQDLKDDKQYQAWVDSGGTLPFPGGESREEFIQRNLNGWEKCKKLLEQEAKKDEIHAYAVVHGGTIMSLMSTFAGGEYFDFQVKNGGGYDVTFSYDCNGNWRYLGFTNR